MSTKTTSEDTNDLDDNNNRKTISWDEEIIKEHDKERGTRMRIVEPNTPYVYYDEDSDKAKSATGEYAGAPEHTKPGELDFTELSNKLNAVKKQQEGVSDNNNDNDKTSGENNKKIDADVYTVSMAEAMAKSNKPKNKDFANKRKAHYNEFQMMKQWKMSQKMNDDDDDDEGSSLKK